MISTNYQLTRQVYGIGTTFHGKSDSFWRIYNRELQGVPLKDTILKSISDEKNLLGEGLTKKGYSIVGLKDYIVRIYKNSFKPEDLDTEFLNAKKNHLNTLEGVILNIPGKIDIIKKKHGKSVGVDNYADRIQINDFPPLRNVQVKREETLKSLEIYKQVKDFPIKAFEQAYRQIGVFCKKPGFQFDILSPNNILIDTKHRKINLIDPVSPLQNNGVHGDYLDFTKFHGADSLYPVLCDFIMQKEHLNNLTPEEVTEWKDAVSIIISKCIIAGKTSGYKENSEQLKTLYERIDKFWGTNDLCKRYDGFNEMYSTIIEQAYTIANSLNHKNSATNRIEAINKLENTDFEKLRPVFEKILEAPHQPKVEFPEIINSVLDKVLKYGKNAKKIIPSFETLFNKEIFYTTKKRLYRLFTLIQPSNKRFLEEMNKSANNVFEKSLYKEEFQNLQEKSKELPAKNRKIIQQICDKALFGENLPQYLIDKLWISRTCTNAGKAQEISLQNMIKAYKHIENVGHKIPKVEDLVELHKIILADTPGEEHIVGRLRTPDTDILIGQIFKINKKAKKPVNDYSASKDVVKDLENLDKYIESNYEKMDTFELAANIFTEVIRIHPFLNGNGRATRLFVEQFLLSKGYRLLKWPEETLYRKICTNEQMAKDLKSCSIKI